jgi:uncharacterized membrane protein HdeD (DUF308 family)
LKTVIIINVFTAVVVFIAGVLILFMPVNQHSTVSIIFGAILIAYGIYRFMNVISKQKLIKQEQKIEKMKIAQEELIRNLKRQKDKNENI